MNDDGRAASTVQVEWSTAPSSVYRESCPLSVVEVGLCLWRELDFVCDVFATRRVACLRPDLVRCHHESEALLGLSAVTATRAHWSADDSFKDTPASGQPPQAGWGPNSQTIRLPCAFNAASSPKTNSCTPARRCTVVQTTF